MNNDTTYALLVQSEEKGRSIMETAVYALLGLSAILSILQFVQQPNRLPTTLTTQAIRNLGYLAAGLKQRGLKIGLSGGRCGFGTRWNCSCLCAVGGENPSVRIGFVKDLTMNERSFIFPAYVTTPDRLFQCRSAHPDP